jgi:WD40 repeat protein
VTRWEEVQTDMWGSAASDLLRFNRPTLPPALGFLVRSLRVVRVTEEVGLLAAPGIGPLLATQRGAAFAPQRPARRPVGRGRQQALELWDAPSGRRLAVLATTVPTDAGAAAEALRQRGLFPDLLAGLEPGPPKPPWRFTFSPDGRRLAASSAEGLRLWDAVTGKEERTLAKEAADRLAFSPDGGRLLATAGEAARLYDAASGAEVRAWKAGAGEWTCFALSTGGRQVATGGDDGLLRLWDVETGRELAHWRAHESGLTALAFHPDGRLLASGGRDGLLRLWDLPALRKELAALGLDW